MRQTMEQFTKKIRKWSAVFPNEVAKTFKNVRTMLITDVRSNYLSGQVLGVRSGRLRSSIQGIINRTPPVSLAIGTDVDYGAIWFSRGRDFLTPSIRKNLSKIEKMILSDLMKKYEELHG